MHILSIVRNKSPLQISGKVAGCVVRTLKTFQHPYIGRIARSSLRKLSCLFYYVASRGHFCDSPALLSHINNRENDRVKVSASLYMVVYVDASRWRQSLITSLVRMTPGDWRLNKHADCTHCWEYRVSNYSVSRGLLLRLMRLTSTTQAASWPMIHCSSPEWVSYASAWTEPFIFGTGYFGTKTIKIEQCRLLAKAVQRQQQASKKSGALPIYLFRHFVAERIG